jgi:hypothetical protein
LREYLAERARVEETEQTDEGAQPYEYQRQTE